MLKRSALGRVLVIPYRFFVLALPRCISLLGTMLRWAVVSKEHYNFTYELSALNRSQLACFISVVSGHPLALVAGYLMELEQDTALRATLRRQALNSPDRHNSDLEPRYGRRAGWYALVRATKPRVVVETGIDRGLGTAVIAAALHRNAAEGAPGIVYATDIVHDCGHLLADPYRQHLRILTGDSVASLEKLDARVDLFIHDSDHRAEYERAEYRAIARCLHSGSLALSDNSQETPELMEFAQSIGKAFLFFREHPVDHWWPGEGIGVAFVPGVTTQFQGELLSNQTGGLEPADEGTNKGPDVTP